MLHVHVHRAGNVLDAVGNLLRQSIVGPLVRPDQLDIDGSRHAEIQNLADHVRGLKEELRAGKILRPASRAGGRCSSAWIVLRSGLQADQNFRVGFADHAGVAVGGVDGAVEQADVVEDRCRDLPAESPGESGCPPDRPLARFPRRAGRRGRACAGGSARRPRSGRSRGPARGIRAQEATQKTRNRITNIQA